MPLQQRLWPPSPNTQSERSGQAAPAEVVPLEVPGDRPEPPELLALVELVDPRPPVVPALLLEAEVPTPTVPAPDAVTLPAEEDEVLAAGRRLEQAAPAASAKAHRKNGAGQCIIGWSPPAAG
jgi:hypothetical protein